MSEKDLSLDHMDRQIIDALQQNGRESYKSIAQKLGVSDGTVRLRTELRIQEVSWTVSSAASRRSIMSACGAMYGCSCAAIHPSCGVRPQKVDLAIHESTRA